VCAGLLREDLFDEDVEMYAEAVRRLPEQEANLRAYRIKRAMDLSLKHRVLPRKQWTTPEEVGEEGGVMWGTTRN